MSLQHMRWNEQDQKYEWIDCVSRKLQQRIIDFMDYLDTCVNLEPAGPSRNKDFHMATECREIKAALSGTQNPTDAVQSERPA